MENRLDWAFIVGRTLQRILVVPDDLLTAEMRAKLTVLADIEPGESGEPQ